MSDNPFPKNPFNLLKISVELEDVSDDTVLGFAIKDGLRKRKLLPTLQMIKDLAKENRSMVSDIVGEKLLTTIEQQ